MALAVSKAGDPVQIFVLPPMLTVGFAFTTWVNWVVAVVGLAQASLETMSSLITSPLLGVMLDNVERPVPTVLPFMYHWYVGPEPPFVNEELKLTTEPAQTAV